MTTREEISDWFDRGQKDGWDYMVVVCDKWDYSDYPVYCSTKKAAQNKWDNPGEMQRAMECYNLKGNKQAQLNQRRCNALAA